MSAFEFFTSRGFSYTFYVICLLGMAALLVVAVLRLFFIGTRIEKLEYLKNYKKGQFALIYVIAIPLYFIGLLHVRAAGSELSVAECFFASVDASFDLLKLSFGMDTLSPYMQANKFYLAVVMICYIETLLNVLFFTASFVFIRFKNFCGKFRAALSRDLCVVIGKNSNNVTMLESLRRGGNKKTRGVMYAKPDPGERDELYLKRVVYSTFHCDLDFAGELEKKLRRAFGFAYRHGLTMNKNVTVVINTEDDTLNLLYTELLFRLLQTRVKIKTAARVHDGDNVYVPRTLDEVPVDSKRGCVTVYTFCRAENRTAFREFVAGSKGHINMTDRYERCALDFTEKYPLTRFMTDKQIDYDTGLVRDVPINVCFIGFGGVNRELFSKLISDSQFYTRKGGKLVHKKVAFHAFDKNEAYLDKNLNQTYFRYSLEFYKNSIAGKPKKDTESVYLPLPDYPADDWCNPDSNRNAPNENGHFHKVDINSYMFYERLRSVVCAGDGAFNYIIVAFGEDLENIDLAKKIMARLSMWGADDGTYVFAKVLHKSLANRNDIKFRVFGSLENVYDLNKIVSDPVRDMAYYKSFDYAAGEVSHEVRREEAVRKWMSSSIEQRNGNYYAVLNLRTKLNLLGFDYMPASCTESDATREFLIKYYDVAAESDVRCKRLHVNADTYTDGSLRTDMAIQEHQRWNAYNICCGVVPADIESIKNGGGKDMNDMLIHYNLTTFEGLEMFAKLKNPAAPDKEEVRKYDYKILDLADFLLRDTGNKIVKKADLR